jgi:hypothetical protein
MENKRERQQWWNLTYKSHAHGIANGSSRCVAEVLARISLRHIEWQLLFF